jgi:protein-disulfide isomerase
VSRQQIVIAISAVVLIALAVAAWYVLSPSDDANAVASGPGYTLTAHDRGLGDPKAKVVLIEYAAPRCPHCAHFNEETFPPLKTNYIDTGKVFYVFRVLPLGAGDGVAEKLARCLPRDKYFPFMDRLFRNQREWNDEFGVTDVRGGLLKQTSAFGMSEAQFDACLANTKQDAIINKVAQDGVDRYGINSTPSIVINGVLTPNVAEYAALKVALDAALAGK